MAGRRLNRGLIERIFRGARYRYLRLILLPESPHRIALGLSLGIFVALTPTVGAKMLISVAMAVLFKGSKVAAALACWLTNPLTVPFFYAIFFIIGRATTPFGHSIVLPISWKAQDLFALGQDVFLAMLIGGMILGIIFAPISYILTYKYIGRLQAWERAKIRRRR